VAQGQVIAFFSLDKTEPNFYQAKHAKHMAVFASQAALALENARLFAAEAGRRREAEILREAAAALTSALELEQVLDNILTHLEQVIPYDSACVFLSKGDYLRAVAGRRLPSPDLIQQNFPVATDDPFVEKLQRIQQPIRLPDAQAEPHFKCWGGTYYIRGWMAVPLLVRGQFIGCITLDSRQVGAYNETQADLAQALANQAAVAIENARLYTETRRRLEEQKALREASTIISSTLE
jgi:GAF domain-containing protein